MAFVRGRWVAQGVILFSEGELSYELIKELETTNGACCVT
jgi:hypothetical protein